jgi:hypothetical protein
MSRLDLRHFAGYDRFRRRFSAFGQNCSWQRTGIGWSGVFGIGQNGFLVLVR